MRTPGVPSEPAHNALPGCAGGGTVEGAPLQGAGAFICTKAGSARPAGVGLLPLGGLAGKPPDAGMTGLPEGCPSGVCVEGGSGREG